MKWQSTSAVSVVNLDEDGSVLVIEQAKTRAGNRRVDIPEFLRPYVRRLSEGERPDAWLFRHTANPGKPRMQQSVHQRVRFICKRAGVPLICTHSLRGMNATLKVQAGASEDYVARSIGHTSFGMTLRHCVDPAVKAAVDALRVDAALAKVGGVALEKPVPQQSSALALLRSLSADERAALLRALLVEHPVQ
jgi:integrase